MGSSPLTRGKPGLSRLRGHYPGLIPAHAGKTCARASPGADPGAHPRSRGENAVPMRKRPLAVGSSPLTRGKLGAAERGEYNDGLIPAHAGKTATGVRRISATQAHPRSRGENGGTADTYKSLGGSSPLTRGKLGCSGVSARRRRLIPAHAGKTSWACPATGGGSGSSPLTRGKLHRLCRDALHLGLIPAHAGKTILPSPAAACWAAHPRSRGENGFGGDAPPGPAGSSPLTRGKHELDVGHARRWGLIPAHAGKTGGLAVAGAGSTAHPRSRGENQNGDDTTAPRKGSSPLTRGKPRRNRRGALLYRLIPAHAGKTWDAVWPQLQAAAHPRSRGENHGGFDLP